MLVTVKVCTLVPPSTSTLPKSVPSTCVGVASPSEITARFVPSTAMSGGVPVPWIVKS
ncbi:MAG: hypothetical protein BWY59_00141 [Verrucomicrobia bacterium ADurb.Bin345]|nr:MAG: hypothetical protein BWY59_00141 [Verrucomicrobia bacterium ADurb.Bin345]